MAKATPAATIELTLSVTLTEAEVRAFDALMGYGTDQFLEFFYKDMGTHYMKPNEAGLRSLFATMKPQCHNAIARVTAARKAFQYEEYEVRKRTPTPTPEGGG